MAKSERSLLNRLVRKVPMPVLAIIFGMMASGVVWVVLDRIQPRAISDIFEAEIDSQLDQRSREALIRFDNFLQSYITVTRLVANHRKMAVYLDPVIWQFLDEGPPIIHQAFEPEWMPDTSIWEMTVPPSHVLLVDPEGVVREIYYLGDVEFPSQLQSESTFLQDIRPRQYYLVNLNESPFLLVADAVEDSNFNDMGFLVILVPIDQEFFVASQQRVRSENMLVALIDEDANTVLASSSPGRVPAGDSVEMLQDEFVVTAQSFFEYEGQTLNALFATLVPKAGLAVTGNQILKLERRHRLTGAAIIAFIFIVLFILVSNRLSRILKRISQFSSRALGIDQPEIRSGNQLLLMEDWIQNFIQMVMRAREEMREQFNAELQEGEALRRTIMNTSLDSIVAIDHNGRIIDFNPTAVAKFGLTRNEAMGQQLDTLLLTEKSREAFNIQLHDCLASPQSGQPVARVLTAVSQAEGEFPVEVSIKPIELGETLVFTTYIRDISERRRQAHEIESLAAIPRESPFPVLRVNSRGVVTYANAASDALLSYWGCGRMQTLPIYWKQQMETALERGSYRESEVHTDAGIYTLLIAPMKHLGYVNVYGRDVTEIRRAEEDARQRQNELIHVSRLSTMGEMATGIAHELNQPLSAILNFANGCARRIRLNLGDKQELIDALGQISNQASRAGEIIKRMRGMVTRQAPVRVSADLNSLINEVCALVSQDRVNLQIAVERHLSDEPLYVRVDPVQIEQVLLNLLRNAFDVLQEQDPLNRRLTIRSGYSGKGSVFVSVRDNGAGIKPDDMKTLFDPFFSTKETGMGMGLSISDTIISDHKGKIRVESFLGKGTTFTVELPASVHRLESLAS
ncbi:MAG: PAS domain-containing sensor histidine kinase [bacterium]